jgi:ketosteroid isomerase-like protein
LAANSRQAVRRVILEAMKNWSNLDADANQAYYTSSDRAVFFDFTPMQYVGWKNYVREIKKVQESIRKFRISLNKDLTIQVRGKLAYAHGTWKMDFQFVDGSRKRLRGRLTEVLEKCRGKWMIVHEHASVPTPH